MTNKEHYAIVYDFYGENISKVVCNHCNYMITHYEVKKTKAGHRWPYMVHNVKKHLRDIHGINLYKRQRNVV